MKLHVPWVNFGNDEGHMRIHSERGRLVDRNGICLAREWDILSGNVAARAEESDVDFFKRSGIEFFDWDGVTAELNGFPD